MRRALVIAAATLQVLALAFMAGQREWVVLRGMHVFLQTEPVDPQDPFRGDFVRLSYDLNHVDGARLDGGLKPPWKTAPRCGLPVYAALVVGEDGMATLARLSDRAPASGLFLKGQVESTSVAAVQARYGIEAYYVEQGRGRAIEASRVRGNVRVPLEMEVAVGANGTAVLVGHRWAPLGIGLDVRTVTVTNPPPATPAGRAPSRAGPRRETWLAGATVVLVNVSSQSVAVVDRRLRLEPARTLWAGESKWRWVGEAQPGAPPAGADVHLLAPSEKRTVSVNFADPTWFVAATNGAPQSLATPEWRGMFRFVYAPPSASECCGLREAARVWHGRLLSRAFQGDGRVD